MAQSSKVILLATVLFGLATLTLFDSGPHSTRVSAQAGPPVLVSQAESTRALALESVTEAREPFQPTAPISFGSDSRTRVMLFAMNLQLGPTEGPGAVTADVEDGAHNIYPLTVEFVGPVPDQPWATSVVVRLNDQLSDNGDVLVRLSYHGLSSNRVRMAIGHVGDGPPDDPGAVPTPGFSSPPPPPGPQATAGNLSPTDVQTVIAQAVSAAAALGHNVTVAVVDREVNVLGVFRMTGGPTTTTIRSIGTAGHGLEGQVVPSELAAISKAGTAALFSTTGNAFSTRTAGFIIQEHFPPGIDFRAGGPLYGV